MEAFTMLLRTLNILFVPMFIWVVLVERRLMKIETSLQYVEKRKEENQ